MSFKVEEEYHGAAQKRFRISIGTGRTTTADSLQEVVFALQHYFNASIPNYPFEYHNLDKQDEGYSQCPLCKEIGNRHE